MCQFGVIRGAVDNGIHKKRQVSAKAYKVRTGVLFTSEDLIEVKSCVRTGGKRLCEGCLTPYRENEVKRQVKIPHL